MAFGEKQKGTTKLHNVERHQRDFMKDKLFKPPETESYLGFIASRSAHLSASADARWFIYAFMKDSIFPKHERNIY